MKRSSDLEDALKIELFKSAISDLQVLLRKRVTHNFEIQLAENGNGIESLRL